MAQARTSNSIRYHISGNGGEEDDVHVERGHVKKACLAYWVSLRMDCRVLVHWWRSLKDVEQARRKRMDCGGLSRQGNGHASERTWYWGKTLIGSPPNFGSQDKGGKRQISRLGYNLVFILQTMRKYPNTSSYRRDFTPLTLDTRRRRTI